MDPGLRRDDTVFLDASRVDTAPLHDAAWAQTLDFSPPSPLRGGPGRGWFCGLLNDPHPQSLPSRGREAKAEGFVEWFL
ncbi:hypothetical protein GCM10007913_24130 [Devosia yakushimensis]|uniref:Uncharacterized protein n=1 Tax=Devosia yakushimensis TaxID=470028 RepID=A0ABQ5UIN4_9HYPH|nr:hypothetical protein GCM10007913_24130 [Devosia yakushimensis]